MSAPASEVSGIFPSEAGAIRPPLVIYHRSCADGFASAWLCHKVWPDAEFFAANYGEAPPPPETMADRRVLVLDFSYSRPILEALAEQAGTLLVLDHHETAEQALAGLPYAHFDQKRSGAGLTREYLYGEGLLDYEPNTWALIAYVEDRDLWQWNLHKSREVNSALASYPFDFDVWTGLANELGPIQRLATEGTAIERYRASVIASACAHARTVNIAGHIVPAVYCNLRHFISDVAGTLAEGQPFGATWFDDMEAGVRQWSLRSRAPDGLDVGAIAKSYPGGGGHRHAAGFSTPLPR